MPQLDETWIKLDQQRMRSGGLQRKKCMYLQSDESIQLTLETYQDQRLHAMCDQTGKYSDSGWEDLLYQVSLEISSVLSVRTAVGRSSCDPLPVTGKIGQEI